MTMDELDSGLKRIGLDLDCDAGRMSRDKILALFGNHLLGARKGRCDNCWYRERGDCLPSCEMNFHSEDPIQVAREYIGQRNDINLVSFICMFAIPIYEQETGSKDTMASLAREFKRRWNEQRGNTSNPTAL